jgi:type III restriction enzyme
MKLKTYQQNTLDILRKFFENCRIIGAKDAYAKITSEPEIIARLAYLRNDYIRWDSIPNTPRVCLKVPTGGGKTIIAAHAVKIISDTWCEKENPFVLWFCPSDTIRRQTSEALKNPRHPYRITLDEQFESHVRIFDIDEKFNIRPADIENNACVIVSTIQAFRQGDTNKYNVYRHNEELEPHFTHIAETKFSFANLMHHHRPIVIVDEAHNVISDLSQEMQSRINPSAIVELTATPRPNNNTLYNVRAKELKEEEMIKLPIELREHLGWEQAVDEAIAKRAELEKAATNETEYIRPILLFQAQDKNGEIGVEALKKYLVETANIPANEIAIATGEQKELDGINVFSCDCPIKYIITVEALKEGWDCSFAYVLCSLANVQSNTAVEQLLGRVMRMPYAKSRKVAALNKAYAYVLSKRFGDATGAIVKKLKDRGFDDAEAAASVEQKSSELGGLFGQTKPMSLSDSSPVAKWEIPAKQGEIFIVPKLMVYLQGEFVFAEPDIIFEEFDWDIAKFASPKLEPYEFSIEPQGNGFVINLDGNQLKFSQSSEQLSMPLVDVENWTVANLVAWLDKALQQDDIPQPKMMEWLRQMVDYLIETRKIKLSALMMTKYVLASKGKAKIENARSEARKQAFQTSLFKRESRVMLNFDNGFEFKEGIYDSEPLYQGNYKFAKHFLGAYKVPMIDGGEEGEEFKCALAIDNLPQVKYWLRNVSKNKNSFWLPTSTDKFYPDFVAMLNDGRILVAEYKGSHLIDSKDTKEKQMIGELWEKQTDGKGLFIIAEKSKDGLAMDELIRKKIGVL